MSHQIEMVTLDDLVPSTHPYRHCRSMWDFSDVAQRLNRLKRDNPYEGYGLLRLFKGLILQFMEDLSDRELARYLQENTAAKWFCEFGLTEKTPDYSVFSRFRSRLGTTFLSELFASLRDQLQSHGVLQEVFSVVDASHLITKANLWRERDEAKRHYDRLNNEVLPKVASDRQARIGCKGKDKYWYGYKKQMSVDMQSGLINKVAVTPANKTDSQGLKHVCPRSGAVYADKGYCDRHARRTAARKGCYLRAIKKNNMKDKDRDHDRWLAQLRAPYERIFAHQPKRTRYRGLRKNQFTEFMQAICFNLKRLMVLDPPGLCLH